MKWQSLDVDTQGRGLPAGGGTVAQGAVIYREKCLRCHGTRGRGALAEELVGGIGSLAGEEPTRTLGSYWPWAPPIFDYVRRAMPPDAPLSLADDEVYAVLAYLLHLNGLFPAKGRLDAGRLRDIRMPNREGFIPWNEDNGLP